MSWSAPAFASIVFFSLLRLLYSSFFVSSNPAFTFLLTVLSSFISDHSVCNWLFLLSIATSSVFWLSPKPSTLFSCSVIISVFACCIFALADFKDFLTWSDKSGLASSNSILLSIWTLANILGFMSCFANGDNILAPITGALYITPLINAPEAAALGTPSHICTFLLSNKNISVALPPNWLTPSANPSPRVSTK